MLDEHQAQLAANRTEIKAKIDEGYAEAQRGELIDPTEVRSQLNERKRIWLREQRRETRAE
jgi:predicted transcriptional regulator